MNIQNYKWFVDGRGSSITDLFPFLSGQFNYTRNTKGTVRGLHRHLVQTDYWIVTEGKTLIVLIHGVEEVKEDEIDYTLGHWEDPKTGQKWGATIDFRIEKIVVDSSQNPQCIKIPPGVLHGAMALTETSSLLYYVDHKYSPEDEGRISWDLFGKEVWEIENK